MAPETEENNKRRESSRIRIETKFFRFPPTSLNSIKEENPVE